MNKAAPQKVDVSATDYVLAHGRAPRGRGTWAFTSKRTPSFALAHVDAAAAAREIFWTQADTPYGAAKKAAVEWARQNNHPVIFVGS